MIIACHQPNYLPNLGFFDKMKKADIFVLYDGVQFSDGFFQHRNRIPTMEGWMWLTIPVERKKAPINTIRIKNGIRMSRRPWREYHWQIISNSYGKTPYFDVYRKDFEKIYLENRYDCLADLTSDIIELLRRIAGLKTKLVRQSALGVASDDASERLAKITERLGGAVYLSGPSGGSKYELNEEEFGKRGIAVAYQTFEHPEYTQYHARRDDEFRKNMPAIDALFNTGAIPV